jgi:hypothetical protein
MQKLNVIVITLAGLGFLGFGIVLLCWPEMALPEIGIQALTDQAQVEIRSMYGGLEIGLGILLLTCFAADRQRFGLHLTLACYGGLGAARLACMLVIGVSTPFLLFALAWEAGFVVLALLALRSKPSGYMRRS